MTDAGYRNKTKECIGLIHNVDIGECPYCERLIDKRYATQKDGGYYHRQCLQDEQGIVQANRIDAMMASLED